MGSSTERLCLRWNDFESNIKRGFGELRQDEEFFDVTLACETRQIKAHKVILSACSPFFRSIIKAVPHQHPLLYLRGVKFPHLESLLSFMYNGEVNVTQDDLNDFLAVAEELKVKGLTQNSSESRNSGPIIPKCEIGVSKQGGRRTLKSEPLESSLELPNKRIRKLSPSRELSSGVRLNNDTTTTTTANNNKANNDNDNNDDDDDDDEIQDITPVKCEPKDSSLDSSVLPPSFHHESGGDEDLDELSGVTPEVSYGGPDDESYDEYGHYEGEAGELNYGDSLNSSLAVPGPSGAADGNKDEEWRSLAEEIQCYYQTISTKDGTGYQCLLCAKHLRDRYNARAHYNTHFNQSTYNGNEHLVKRLDDFISRHTIAIENNINSCMICRRVIKTQGYSALRAHFLFKHLNVF